MNASSTVATQKAVRGPNGRFLPKSVTAHTPGTINGVKVAFPVAPKSIKQIAGKTPVKTSQQLALEELDDEQQDEFENATDLETKLDIALNVPNTLDTLPVPGTATPAATGIAACVTSLLKAPTARPIKQTSSKTPAGSKRVISKARVTQNGITECSPGTIIARQFAIYDAIRATGAEVTIQTSKEVAKLHNMDETTCALSLYKWRKFHGITKASKAK